MPRKERHDPTRTCVGCGERASQSGLLRLRATAEGRLSESERRGRSAYLHACATCVRGLARSKYLARALRRNIVPEFRSESVDDLLRRLASRVSAG